MIYKSSRRSLLKRGAGLVLAYGARGIIPGVLWSVSRVATAVDFRDLMIRTQVPGENGQLSNLILSAEALRDGVDAAGLNGFEGPQFGGHDHPIIVTASQIAQLNAGQTVNGQTQGVNGGDPSLSHSHGFSISPNDYATTRVLTVEDTAPDSNSSNSDDSSNSSNVSTDGLSGVFAMTLTEGVSPYLIIESKYDLQSNKISYTLSRNGEESNNYLALGRLAVGGSRNLYRSQIQIPMDQVKFIHVYGENRDGILLHDIFEVGVR